MGDVVDAGAYGLVTKADIPPEKILRAASEADLASVVVIGWLRDEKGELDPKAFYLAASEAYGPDVIYALEIALRKVIDIGIKGMG